MTLRIAAETPWYELFSRGARDWLRHNQKVRDAVMNVLRVSMSEHGYALSRDTMRLNRFLGDLVGGPEVMGEWSFTFCLFGEPSANEPWGWQFFGHHVVLNCFVLGNQMVATPAFWGAEPSYADHGPFKGIRIFQDEERAGLKLMRSFSPEQQKRAIVHHSMMGGDLPEGRRHFADNLHRALGYVQDLSGGLLVTGPSEDDLNHPEIGPKLKHYLGARAGSMDRMKLLNLISDLTTGDFGGYQAVLAIHAEGSIEAEKITILRSYDSSRTKAYAKWAAGIEDE